MCFTLQQSARVDIIALPGSGTFELKFTENTYCTVALASARQIRKSAVPGDEREPSSLCHNLHALILISPRSAVAYWRDERTVRSSAEDAGNPGDQAFNYDTKV